MPSIDKYFNGSRINSDDSIEYLANNDILDGYNVRVQSRENNAQGLVISVEGTRHLEYDLPAGVNVYIGSKFFPEVNKAYIFVKNGIGKHRIIEFDADFESFSTIYEDLTNSDNVQLLNFSDVVMIKDIHLIQKDLLYFNTFPQDNPYRMYISDFKGISTRPKVADDFYLSVPTPNTSPRAEVITDSNYTFNNIRGNFFQFRYRFKFKHDEYSPWSPISNRAISDTEAKFPDLIEVNNAVRVEVPLDYSFNFEGIEISARTGNDDWFTIREVSRNYIENLDIQISGTLPEPEDEDEQPVDFPLQQEYQTLAFEPNFSAYGFIFYNDGLYSFDDQLEHDLLTDYIPDKVRAMSSVNDNAILLANYTYGKEKPTPVFDLDLDFSNDDNGLSDSLQYIDFLQESLSSPPGNVTGKPITKITFSGVPIAGDVIALRFYNNTFDKSYPSQFRYEYTTTSATAGNLIAVINALVALIPSDLLAQPVSVVNNGNGTVTATITSKLYTHIQGASYMTYLHGLTPSISLSETSFRVTTLGSMKMGSSYELCVAYYDRYGRPFPLSEGKVIKTPLYAEANGAIPTIKWSILNNPPEGAYSYKILSTPNRTHLTSIYTTASIQIKDDKYKIKINDLFKYNKEVNSGNLDYQFTPGDMVNIISDIEYKEWVDSPIRNLAIQSFEIDVVDENQTNYYIYTVKPTGASQITDLTSVIIEIYTPRSSTANDFYYEVTPSYRVINGQHSVTNGDIKFIDTYRKTRQFSRLYEGNNQTYNIYVEDFNYSDSFPSKYGNLGRPRAKFDTTEPTRFSATIRYGRQWVTGSSINNINRFYPEDFYDSLNGYGPSEQYGGVQYLINRENRLVCIQELKLGYIPVNRIIIEDVMERTQIGISSKLLNPITYSAGPDIGIGKDYTIPSMVFANGSVYFVDPHNQLPVRANTNSIGHITYKATSRLKSIIKKSLNDGFYMRGVWDSKYNEYLLTHSTATEVWNEDVEGWVPNRTFKFFSGFSAKNKLYTMSQDKVYAHDDEVNRGNLHGVQYNAGLEISITSQWVKTFNSIAIHSDSIIITEPEGIRTEINHVCDLIYEDFNRREDVNYANFPRDYNTDPIDGDRLKGRWITLKLLMEPVGAVLPMINLHKVTVKFTQSTPNE